MEMLELDGSQGGGQLLRSALSLSLCTGIGFTLQDIRAKRSKPGLMRQHLTAVNAAAKVGGANVIGAELGATSLRFEPGTIRSGDYEFSTGSAGSCTLVLQTVLPALWSADATSRVRLQGGTHNPLAPCADFLAESFVPRLRDFGIEVDLELESPGFYPAGGGVLHATVHPARELRACAFESRGELERIDGTALLSALSSDIGLRELAVLQARFDLGEDARHLRQVRPPRGPGNALILRVRHAAHTTTFTGFGQRGTSAETVAARVANEAQTYLDSGACIDEYLGDQLLLPMALAGGGSLTTTAPSDHLRSNAALIEKFLPVEITWEQQDAGTWRVTVKS
ncbi:RNA 3'-terminal phosphate cyclase [Pseudomarimonas arenosa]|uniref:RNA 3'-terminal phosphate cyclase n=1 Tax=Pseudomarimonas arenosa TaxID=2774145 RepID=A0AAW3ZLQ7_9GAMM|nr:RNA 3'-terminal phosphate cyclase [Pseudomarimonas arenosa]MBD8526903.1 RNA 3'-terminal phosphate cyclase [Pseudomarimonas arenosa]